jgi:hypothetical protein
MRSPGAERALRRLVARLATAAPSDIDLVLDTLEPQHRDEVRALLAVVDPSRLTESPRLEDRRPAEVAPAPAPGPEPEPDVSHLIGLSPWLSGQVLAAADPETRADARMTRLACAALAEVARRLPPEPSSTFSLPAAEPRGRGGPLGWLRFGE